MANVRAWWVATTSRMFSEETQTFSATWITDRWELMREFSVVRLDMDNDIGCRHRPHRCHRRIGAKLMKTITDDVHKISCKNNWLRLVGGHYAAMTENMWHSTEWYELRVAFCETGISNRFNRKWFCDVNLTARQSIDGWAVCGHNVLKLKSQHPRQRRSDHYFIRFFFVFFFFVPSNWLNWCDTVKVENIFGNRNQTIDDSVVAPTVRSLNLKSIYFWKGRRVFISQQRI